MQILTLNRKKQLQILESALPPISSRLEAITSSNSFCHHAQNAIPSNFKAADLLSLECAFEWLHLNYLSIYTAVVQMISDDQQEPLPLDWRVLIEDWDHTYWAVWLFTILIISVRDGNAFKARHEILSSWLAAMANVADCEYTRIPQVACLASWGHIYLFEIGAVANPLWHLVDVFYAESDEKETIDHMIEGMSFSNQKC